MFYRFLKLYLFHVCSEPHGRGLIIWFVPLVVLYCDLYRKKTQDLNQHQQLSIYTTNPIKRQAVPVIFTSKYKIVL